MEIKNKFSIVLHGKGFSRCSTRSIPNKICAIHFQKTFRSQKPQNNVIFYRKLSTDVIPYPMRNNHCAQMLEHYHMVLDE